MNEILCLKYWYTFFPINMHLNSLASPRRTRIFFAFFTNLVLINSLILYRYTHLLNKKNKVHIYPFKLIIYYSRALKIDIHVEPV